MPKGLFDGVRTMTTNIVLEMNYASGTHKDALIATGAILFIFILILNITFQYSNRGGGRRLMDNTLNYRDRVRANIEKSKPKS